MNPLITFTVLLPILGLAAAGFSRAAEEAPPAETSAAQQAPPPLQERDLVGVYVQLRSAGIMHFQKGGRIEGWPAGGSFKIVSKDRIELFSGPAGKEEKLPVTVERADHGLVLVREMDGEKEVTPLLKMEPVKPDAVAWQGPAVIHVLISSDKQATRRDVTLDKDGFFKTKEGGYYLRIFERGGNTLAHLSGLEDKTKWVSLYKTGPVLVLFDSLTSPSLLAVIELGKSTKQPAAGGGQ